VSAQTDVEVAIVGTGFSGLGMAVYLKKAGIHSFALLEKAHGVGGTWRENHYPGAACDVPSHLYSFSFEPNPGWTRAYSPQAEILAYLEHCARKYDLMKDIHFGAEVERASYDEASGKWTVRAKSGLVVTARSLVLGNGALHLPSMPNIAGRESFEGASFHSARWDHSYDLNGKTVAVIGTGASAIQFVPEIVKQVKKLHLFQRTPAWITPKADREISRSEQKLFARVPAAQLLMRAGIYLRNESFALGFVHSDPRVLKIGERMARKHLKDSVADPLLREKLTPNYKIGCKRVLISNDFYPAVCRENVEVVTDAIDRIEPRGLRTRDGRLREVDAILYGTGFTPTDYLSPIQIVGTGGRELNATWKHVPEAYLGITVTGYPNLFLLMGPNTGLGHNSMIFMIEAQARYALQAIQTLREGKLRAIEVRASVQADFNNVLREKMQGTVWASGCKSWYMSEDGSNPLIWPGFTADYWMRTRRLQLADYSLRA
jgi:cation diffusion facilitator CzcD-associated flavoprotein CzcO